jgi:hypothetical protein
MRLVCLLKARASVPFSRFVSGFTVKCIYCVSFTEIHGCVVTNLRCKENWFMDIPAVMVTMLRGDSMYLVSPYL